MMMKKRLLVVFPVCALSFACVPGAYTQRSSPGPFRPYQPGPAFDASRYAAAPLPIGRWDNVMMLAAGTPVQVLKMDGGLASGPVISADMAALRIHAAAGVVEIDAAEVMRIDRLASSPAKQTTREAAKGAAVGAGAVGVIGLIAGRVPPARVFLAGAALGGYNQTQMAALAARGPEMVYLAAAAAPAARRQPHP